MAQPQGHGAPPLDPMMVHAQQLTSAGRRAAAGRPGRRRLRRAARGGGLRRLPGAARGDAALAGRWQLYPQQQQPAGAGAGYGYGAPQQRAVPPLAAQPPAKRVKATGNQELAPRAFPQLSAISGAKARAACSAVKAVLALVLVKTEAPVAFKADTLCALAHSRLCARAQHAGAHPAPRLRPRRAAPVARGAGCHARTHARRCVRVGAASVAGSHQALVRGTQQRVHAHARRHGGVARARAAVARPPAAPCWQGGAPRGASGGGTVLLYGCAAGLQDG